jgi:biotin-dependent carboxylase-like uncharacterized protein
MTAVFKVLFPGAFTTIQDKGRFGYQAFGVPVSGSLDFYAHRVANLLVGNSLDTAALELTVLGPKLEAMAPCCIALTGGDLQPFLNQLPMPQWVTVKVKKGDVLFFKGVKTGCRAYLAVEGGFDVPEVMGSRSTYPKGGIGGINGGPITAGDILRKGKSERDCGKTFPEDLIPSYPRERICHVISGPQAHFFGNIEDFYNTPYEVTSKADRMGYRLKGIPLVFREGAPASIISEAIVPGAIQIPADGQPIVLMVEQTVGGYAKVGVITTPDRWRLAQLRPGDKVSFKPVSVLEAQKQLRDTLAELEKLKVLLMRK